MTSSGRRRPLRGLRALVVGGSIGGLSAALVLRDAGFDVEVFERSPRPLEGRGVGIVLHPATIRYLRERGALDLDDISVRADTLRYVDREGASVVERPVAYRFTWYSTLHERLLRLFTADGYHLASQVDRIDRTDCVSIGLSDGRTARGDLVVGADGVRSTLRQHLFPALGSTYAGYVGWRGAVEEDALAPAVVDALRGKITYHIGPDHHALVYPIPGASNVAPQWNWVWYRNVPAGGALDDLMTGRDGVRYDLSLAPQEVDPGQVEIVRREAGVLPPVLRELVLACPEPFVQVIVDIAAPRMAVGRVCLVGDAAFTIRPHVAAGTAKAADDAWSLGEHLQRAGGDVDGALATWEPERLALARAALARSRDLGERVQSRGTYRPGDPDVLFGLMTSGDSDISGDAEG
jgi:2,6-dihydroxypyridine 3-monooxygenase